MTVGELIKQLVKVRNPKMPVFIKVGDETDGCRVHKALPSLYVTYAEEEEGRFILSDVEEDETRGEEEPKTVTNQRANVYITDDDIPF